MSTQPSLFPEPREQQVARIDAEIAGLLLGHRGGPLGLTAGPEERAVLGMIRYHRGASAAVTLREIQQRTKLDVRAIKQAVRTLRLNFHLPIGSSKSSETGGYFLMITAEDRAIWTKDVISQVLAEVALLRRAAGRQAGLELLGQLQIEFNRLDSDGEMQ